MEGYIKVTKAENKKKLMINISLPYLLSAFPGPQRASIDRNEN